ncbi:RNA polymerase sigma factor [Mucilaginibacter lacusdianchii]|uniref:RNA polymerase sigma factor n=1 Tax=Mucilaginibacter lacusdianchii TaxID=2684211 RepID=UPI00131B8E0C|nr:RNA polymerase sigma factor [Mucilaginibacter sp. JXJ CY 39]
MTDEALMICIKNDDLSKVALLYERYKQRLLQYFAYRSFSDRDVSKDLVQQVFLRVIEYRKSFKDEGNFKVWLYAIAANVNRQEIKYQMQRKDSLFAYSEEYSYVMENDDYKIVHQILKKLPEQYGEVLMMSKFWRMKYEEIAALKECSVGVIKTRVYRAMQLLKEAYFKLT